MDPDAEHGFGFDGVFLRPGATVTDAELHPTPEYPATPVVLEYMLAPAHGIAGRRRSDAIYILWRYETPGDFLAGSWRELGRATSESWHWATELRPLALRALREARGAALVVILPDLPAIARRIAAALDHELKGIESEHRQKVLGVLHDEFAVRLCA